MIAVRYRGGLGNQMFQYAFSLALEKKYGIPVLADTTHYRLNGEHNGFELETLFQIRLNHAEKKDLAKLSPYYVPGRVFDKLPEQIRHLIANNLQYKYWEYKKAKVNAVYYKQAVHNTFEPEVFSLDQGQDWYLDGLWQDLRYFEACQNEVRAAFSFRNEMLYSQEDRSIINLIKETNAVGIHVRRGDFVNSKFDLCGRDYYDSAIRTIEECADKPFYFFFSDDPDYVASEFKEIKNKRIVKHDVKGSILDMEMLSLCKHVIISNSTFSLWAAWLGDSPERFVIAPKYSIVNHGKKFELNVPQHWIQLDI